LTCLQHLLPFKDSRRVIPRGPIISSLFWGSGE
jgi:hypothetical protein